MKFIINKWKQFHYRRSSLYILFALIVGISIFFVYNNYSFYDRTIAKVIDTHIEDSEEIIDRNQNKDYLYSQSIIAELKNGERKGQEIYLNNQYSASGAYDQEFQVGNDLFVSIEENSIKSSQLTGDILGVKRDKYLVIVAWVFIFTLLLVGKKQGLYSIISLGINIIIISYALDVYIHTANISLLWVCAISVILFTVITLLLVNGVNEKTYAAIVATLVGTFLSQLITYLVMVFTSESGLYYEGMGFLTRSPYVVFIAGLFIGSLGAVMDVAVTMSSSIYSLYEKNNNISIQALKKSGLEIGKDIMGTMTNILFFAYIGGTIPILILSLKNGSLVSYTFSINLSLELTRALAGGIGIVLTIPIGLYTALLFIHWKRERT